jgi:hypothetical protein
LLGYAFVTLACAALLAAPALWATVRVLRVKAGFAAIAPRALSLVLVIVGFPVAVGALLLAAFSYACLF